jgi:DNA-binding MarR family transcriptional regulator
MVTRAANPDVRREVIVSLTGAGRRVVDDVTTRRRTDIAPIVAAMEPSERTQLVVALRAFAAAGGEPPADVAPSGLSPLGSS